MKPNSTAFNRRRFIKTTAAITTGITGLALFSQTGWTNENYIEEGVNIIGPKEGFSPQVGTLVSMMTWMRMVVLSSVQGMKPEDLDYLHDAKSNTIGALLLHLAATEVFYQGNTFDAPEFKKQEPWWNAAMNLGDLGRNNIKGNSLDYYLNILKATREKTLTEFRKRDDKWLMTVDPSFFGKQPTNNYCKWFHVCEHESNHNGQIKWLKGRLPGGKSGE